MSGGRKYTLALAGLGVLVLIGVGFFIRHAGAELWSPWFTAFVAHIAQYGVVNAAQKATAKAPAKSE